MKLFSASGVCLVLVGVMAGGAAAGPAPPGGESSPLFAARRPLAAPAFLGRGAAPPAWAAALLAPVQQVKANVSSVQKDKAVCSATGDGTQCSADGGKGGIACSVYGGDSGQCSTGKTDNSVCSAFEKGSFCSAFNTGRGGPSNGNCSVTAQKGNICSTISHRNQGGRQCSAQAKRDNFCSVSNDGGPSFCSVFKGQNKDYVCSAWGTNGTNNKCSTDTPGNGSWCSVEERPAGQGSKGSCTVMAAGNGAQCSALSGGNTCSTLKNDGTMQGPDSKGRCDS